MLKIKEIILFVSILSLQACSVTQPVVGQFSKTKDDFMGEATSTLSDGTLKIRTLSGIDCSGTLQRPTSLVSGNGNFKCSDGRTGTFVFTKSNEFGGTGFGSLSDGEKFRFLWGNQVSRRDRCDLSNGEVSCAGY